LICVHDCEGGYAGSINWFVTSKDREAVSAHVVLREDGLEATQMVEYEDSAWACCNLNKRSLNLEMAGFKAKGFGAPEWQVGANIVAYWLHRFGIPCQWSRQGMLPGFCSHYQLGAAGGGHVDPTTDPAIWANFVDLVTEAYKLTPPDSWPGEIGVVPPMPKGFVPTPTMRRD
jgi:hypothetical protein